jgi:hypothetical protein
MANETPNTPKVTVEQAIGVVISAVRQLKLNFEEHCYMQQCLEVINSHCTTPDTDKIKVLPKVLDS